MKRYLVIGPLALVMIWLIVSWLHLIDPFFLPGPLETGKELLKMIVANNIFGDVFSTMKRICIAFLLAAVTGVPVGLMLGMSPRLYKSCEFLIDFFRSIAPLALFPLFLIIFGVNDASKVAVAAWSGMIVVIFNVAYGIMHSNKSRFLAAKIMGAKKTQIFRSVIFWEGLPQTFVGLRNAISWITSIVIATEMFVGTNSGLGHKIVDLQITYLEEKIKS